MIPERFRHRRGVRNGVLLSVGTVLPGMHFFPLEPKPFVGGVPEKQQKTF